MMKIFNRVFFFVYRIFYRLRRRARLHPYRYMLGTAVVVVIFYVFFISAPFYFPTGAYVSIPPGSSLTSTAQILKDRGVLRSASLFKFLIYISGAQHHITAGEYFFPARNNALSLARRLANGDFEVEPARVRVPEGATANEIGKLLAQDIPDFNVAEFTIKTRGKEGYLFPDTYFFMPGQGVDSILGAFANNFNTHISKIQGQIDSFGKPLSDVIVMASLLEREAPSTNDRRIIAGILWKRIRLGMRSGRCGLPVYHRQKNSFELTKTDLAYNSPYNTYTHTGLPPGPIANPGEDAIVDAITPIETSYLYYLSDKNGTMHYSATYAQHLAAKSKYPRGLMYYRRV